MFKVLIRLIQKHLQSSPLLEQTFFLFAGALVFDVTIRQGASQAVFPARLGDTKPPFKNNSYLWTYDLYGPVRYAFDAGKSVTRAIRRGLGPGNRDFFILKQTVLYWYLSYFYLLTYVLFRRLLAEHHGQDYPISILLPDLSAESCQYFLSLLMLQHLETQAR